MAGYPWSSGETLTADDLNAAIAGASIWHAGVVTALGTNLSLAGGVLSAASASVTSVAGRTGAVTLTHSDLTDWASATSSYLTSTTAASTYAPLASPTFTGTVTIPGGASISGYLTTAIAASTYAPLASPTFTGSVVIPGGTINNATVGATTATTGRFTTITSTIATGTAPLTVASTTNVANLNASSLSGATFAAPGAIGSGTPGTGAFTTLSASSTVSGAGITTLLAPYAPLASPTFTGTVTAATTNVGAFTATGITSSPISGSTGSFTTLAASSTVSGTGFTDRFASPGPIGNTSASTGAFSTLSASSTVSGAGFTTLLTPYALLASPTFTGTPAAPTATLGTTTTQVATTAFVAAAVTAATAGVSSFNTRTGAVTLTSGDVTTALTFTPYNATNPSGYQTAADVTTTLASPPAIGGSAAAAGSFTTLSATSTVSGAGFSTYLASPPAIGGSAAAAGSFTTLSATSTVSGAGFSTYLASPPAIGGSAAAAGSFTTLSASSTVSGAGFSTYLASPPAIGGSAAAAGSFTTLSASSTVSGAGITSLLSPYAPLASPTFTGTPSLPTGTTGVTQGAGDNTTKLATTAFVTAAAASPGGGAVATPSTNQTLTSASSRARSYAFTAAALTVTLPDATTLSAGGPLFSLFNAGGYTFGVRRNGGTLLTAVPPGCAADLYLDDNGTAAGTWHAAGQGLQSAFETVSTTLTGALIASTTTLLGFIGSVAIYWQGTSTGVQAYDTVGGTVGSVATLTSAATSPILLTVDSTHGLIVYYGSSNICAQVLTLSGTSITVQTQATIATGTPTGLAAAVTLTTGSSYLVAYNISGGAEAVQLGVSGTTATFGSALGSGASGNWIGTRPLSVISSTQVFGVASASIGAVRVIGISGSTLTMNTAATAFTTPTIALALSTTLFLLCEGSTGLQAVSVSGTTCTIGTQSTSFGSNTFTGGQFAISSTSFIVGNSADPGVLYYGTISGTTITAAASLTVADNWAVGGTSAAITLPNSPVVAVSAGYLYLPSEGVLTASGSAFSNVQPDLWPDQMMISGSVALQDGAGGTIIPLAAGDGFRSLATAQTSGNLLVKPGRIYPVGGYTAALSGAISTGKFLVGTASPGRTAPTGSGAQWRVATWELAT